MCRTDDQTVFVAQTVHHTGNQKIIKKEVTLPTISNSNQMMIVICIENMWSRMISWIKIECNDAFNSHSDVLIKIDDTSCFTCSSADQTATNENPQETPLQLTFEEALKQRSLFLLQFYLKRLYSTYQPWFSNCPWKSTKISFGTSSDEET